MALRIVEEDQAVKVDRIFVLLYAPPGVGKTTLANTARKPLLLDFDNGVTRSLGRKRTVQVKSWDDVANIEKSDLDKVETLIVDTGGSLIDKCIASIIHENPKMSKGSGELAIQGYGALKSRVIAFINLVKGWDKDIVFICHSKEEKSGDEIKQRIVMAGSAVQEVMQQATMIGMVTSDQQGRKILFAPRSETFSKDSASIGDVDIPKFREDSTFLGDLIEEIKAKINARNEAKGEVAKEREVAIKKAKAAKDVDAMNKVLIELSSASIDAKRLAFTILSGTAEDIGATWDKVEKKFIVVRDSDPQQEQQEQEDDAQV
jgi:AAA domain